MYRYLAIELIVVHRFRTEWAVVEYKQLNQNSPSVNRVLRCGWAFTQRMAHDKANKIRDEWEHKK